MAGATSGAEVPAGWAETRIDRPFQDQGRAVALRRNAEIAGYFLVGASKYFYSTARAWYVIGIPRGRNHFDDSVGPFLTMRTAVVRALRAEIEQLERDLQIVAVTRDAAGGTDVDTLRDSLTQLRAKLDAIERAT